MALGVESFRGVFLTITICFLSGFTDVKLFDVQLVEMMLVGALAVSLLSPRQKLTVDGPDVIVNLLPKFAILIFFLLVGSLLSLRLQFFTPSTVGPLKHPPIATFVRLFEVVLAISSLFVVSLTVRSNPDAFRKLLAAYVWSALIGSIWGILSWVGWYLDLPIELPGVTVLDVTRVRGFFFEGGPFGVYLIGAIILQVVRGHYLKYIPPRAFWPQLGVLLVAFVGTQSKAAVLLAGMIVVIYLVRTKHIRLMLALAVAMTPVALTSNLVAGLNGYYVNYANYEQAAFERPEDTALVLGRLAASVLLPRIVAAHPFLGVGIGNYSLVRNDPSILRGLPVVDAWDLHGLGLLGYMAELGVPLTLFVMWLYVYPLIHAWRSRPWIVLICSYPLMAALFGVQLNFAYPWIFAGLGLAAIAIDRDYRARLSAVADVATPVLDRLTVGLEHGLERR